MNEIWKSIGFSEDCDLLTLVRKKIVEQLHLKDSGADTFYRIERDPNSKRLMYHLMCTNELGYWMSDRAASLARVLIRSGGQTG